MTTLRQLPQILIRGSIANITMANITKDQREDIDKKVIEICSHEAMAPHRQKFIDGLSNRTIKGDYRDRNAADQEFQIAVWRGVVDLFYHKNYSGFQCDNCKAAEYNTLRGKKSPINRQSITCPSCKCTKVIYGNDDYADGRFLNEEEIEKALGTDNPPKLGSPISYINAEQKYEDPQSIIDDPKQMAKFFGEFVANYFRQHVSENIRKEHRQQPRTIICRADEAILEQMISICKKHRIKHNYSKYQCDKHHIISLMTNCVQTSATPEFAQVFFEAVQNKVGMKVEPTCIKITIDNTLPLVSTVVIKPEHVIVLNSTSAKDGEHDPISQVKGNDMEGTALLEITDAIGAIRGALPNDICQSMFDIFSQQGQPFDDFTETYGDKPPRIQDLAEWFGISTKQVKAYKSNIRINMIRHNLVPS